MELGLRSSNRAPDGTAAPVKEDLRLSYGTAGFRYKADILPFVLYRVGRLVALRARVLGKSVGLMITASHNPEGDNGVKLVDPLGEMLSPDWEVLATDLVNAKDDQWEVEWEKIVGGQKSSSEAKCQVLCGRDTRVSSAALSEAARAGVASANFGNVEWVDVGEMSTPQLHYAVRCANDPAFGVALGDDFASYDAHYAGAFVELYKMPVEANTASTYDNELWVDCACGVGAKSLEKVVQHIPKDLLTIHIVNSAGKLNHGCGADFVKIDQKPPIGFGGSDFQGRRCASLDGDADRLVYFFTAPDGRFCLLDGDKIAVLYAKYLQEALSAAGLADTLKLGIVQTAYANGASTQYIRDVLKVETRCVPTGVKHLHHAAQHFDIGVYFEANGHGTVCFSDTFKDAVAKDQTEAHRRLRLFSILINEVVGDGIADLLVVESILRYYGWSVDVWFEQQYKDRANRQIKVPVVRRDTFHCIPDESRLDRPEQLQKLVDQVVEAAGQGARAFVRPSGTEAIVRVYAESERGQAVADNLANAISHITSFFE